MEQEVVSQNRFIGLQKCVSVYDTQCQFQAGCLMRCSSMVGLAELLVCMLTKARFYCLSPIFSSYRAYEVLKSAGRRVTVLALRDTAAANLIVASSC